MQENTTPEEKTIFWSDVISATIERHNEKLRASGKEKIPSPDPNEIMRGLSFDIPDIEILYLVRQRLENAYRV